VSSLPTPSPQADPLLRRHLIAVDREWRRRLCAAWADATPAARARALELFADGGRSTRSVHAAPPIETVALAVRHLRSGGVELPDPTPLERILLGLDLRCVPGAFEAGREPGPMTVHLWPMVEAVVKRTSELSLHWIAPDGARVRARTEPVAGGAFRRPGFEMFVRTPRAEAAGNWRLHALVEEGGRVLVSEPIGVPGVRALEERRARVAAGAPDPELLAVVDDAVSYGLRVAAPLTVGRALSSLEGEPWTTRDGPIAPLLDPGWPAGRVWATPLPDRPPRTAVIVLATRDEPAWEPLAGAVGRAWLDFAREEKAVVVATDLPLAAREVGGEDVGRLTTFLREELEATTVVLVVRRDANFRFLVAQRAGRVPPVHGVVFSTHVTGHGEPPRPTPLPCLVVDTRAPESGVLRVADESGAWSLARTPLPNVLVDLELPAHTSEWLAEERG